MVGVDNEIGNDEEINRLVDPEWGPGAQGDAGDSNDDMPFKDDEIAHVHAPTRVWVLPGFTENEPAVLFRGEENSAVARPGQNGAWAGQTAYVQFPERLYGPFVWQGEEWLPHYQRRVFNRHPGGPTGDSPPPSAQPPVIYLDSDASAVLRGMAAEVRALNQEKGWYDRERSFGDEMVNLHGEVSEAWEAYRAHGFEEWEGKGGKPEGVGSEMADVLIRLLDSCASHGIDLFAEYRRKMAFNATRPYRHGGKRR